MNQKATHNPVFPDVNETVRQSATYTNVGLQIALSFLVFVILGSWLDRHYNKTPLFTLIGVGFGILGMGYQLRILLLKMKEQDKFRPKRTYNPKAYEDVDKEREAAENDPE